MADLFLPEAAAQNGMAPTTQHAAHYSKCSDDNWGTPPWLADLARVFMGGAIDLDPASDAFRNETIKAARFLGLADIDPKECLPWDWGGATRIFINPPGGVAMPAWADKKKSLPGLFWRKLELESARRITFVWYCYNINQLQVLQAYGSALVRRCSVCVPDERVKNIDRFGKTRGGTPSAAAILGLGRPGLFADVFNDVGAVWSPFAGRPLDGREHGELPGVQP